MSIICFLIDHNYKYNFSTLPNRAICSRCKQKFKLNLHTLHWSEVDNFGLELRTDIELIEDWN